MKIAQVSPLYESVPPKLYGGTERVVSYLTEALIDLGHDVTLFASGDSCTRARLISSAPEALRLKGCVDPYAYHFVQLKQVIDMAYQFDAIHFHTDYFHFPASMLSTYTHLTTLHGRLDLPELKQLYTSFRTMPVVSISYSQRKPLPHANWAGNVYHGLPEEIYPVGDGKGGYAVFVGRFSPEKRPDRAIEIAKKAGLKIKIAAKVDRNDQDYFKATIEPLLAQPHVEYVGEIGEEEKADLLGNASVMLFPIDWAEPFGMVMIESLACGTPVVAFGQGSVPEVLDNGKTGFIVSSVDEAVDAVRRINTLSRETCRRIFAERFTSKRMAKDYVHLYEHLLDESRRVDLPLSSRNPDDIMSNVLSA